MSITELDFYLNKFKTAKTRTDLMRKMFDHLKSNCTLSDQDIKWEIREILCKHDSKLPDKFKLVRKETVNVG